MDSSSADPDVDLLTFAGVVVAILWSTAVIEHRLSGVWESHRAATAQWLILGAVFPVYLCSAACFATRAARFRRRTYELLARASGSQRRLRRAVITVCAAFATIAALGILSLFSLPPTTAGALVLSAAVAICCTLRFGHGLLSRVTSTTLELGKRVLRGFGIAPTAGFLWKAMLRIPLIAVLLATAAWLVVDAHRSIALGLGLAQGLMLQRMGAPVRFGLALRATVIVSSALAWIFAAGLTYTPIAEWLLGATKSTAGSGVIFSASLALVVTELYIGRHVRRSVSRRNAVAIALVALAGFVVLSLSTSDLFKDWVPYHRSYWVGPADFVRQGAWLLWDVPSQYGFLSALSLAVWPSASTWQALYEQTAIALVFDASVLFALLRYRRQGPLNAVFCSVAAATMFFSSLSSRAPFGWRLYPQIGLRFTGVIAILAIAFLLYLWRNEPRRRTIAYICGFATWAASALWSFESGVLVTLVWLPFVLVDVLREAFTSAVTPLQRLRESGKRLCWFILIPLCVIAIVEVVYRSQLDHGPDWRSYSEFAFAYNTVDLSRQAIKIRGPGWLLLTSLITCGAVAARAAQKGAYETLPVFVACWLAVWSACNYYVAEAFSNHVNGVAPVIATAFAVLLAVHRARETDELVTLPVRALIAPLIVLVIAQSFSWPSLVRRVATPLISKQSFDSLLHAPLVHGELAALLRVAHIRDFELIVYPVSIWDTKAESALILPFVRSRTGDVIQQYAWLPLSPIGPYNELDTLSPDRRRSYLRRFYERVHATGWLVSYHERVDCSRLIRGLRTTDVHRSVNFQIGRCRSGG